MDDRLVFFLAWCACTGLFGYFAYRTLSRLLLQFRGERATGYLVRFRQTSGENPTTMAVYRFSIGYGAAFEFEEEAPWGFRENDPVLVRYWRRNPGRTATTVGRGGTWRPLFSNLLPLAVTGGISGGFAYVLFFPF
ncbi:DUF3592 domain-containing protein [Saccharothrix obliqua]|uniref:DUF3592 domain-containing protein n=1 Tax=Saccharothrix obliqua TaxID=2861747 RepID=UPI001C5D6946|nr:DUF3592 domain-containing protein [Saccharothrix obliqua]MBW4718479.1 hypothetical protein [Saccharothrix obliqua]